MIGNCCLIHHQTFSFRERTDLSSPGNSPIILSPRSKKRPAPIPMEMDNVTPSKKSIKLDASLNVFTPKEKMAPPSVPNVQLRAKWNKKINSSTSAWKTLSLSRRDKVKNDASSQIFRSPSIYENNAKEEENEENTDNNIMNRYLSGKMVPLTPSQQPTNVSHLVKNDPVGNDVEPVGYDVEPDQNKQMTAVTPTSTAVVPSSTSLTPAVANYCAIM